MDQSSDWQKFGIGKSLRRSPTSGSNGAHQISRNADIERDKTFLKGSIFATDEMLRQVVAGTGAEFVSPLRTLCNGEGCLLVVPDTNGLPIYWDDNHFTRSGAIYFVDHNAAAFAVP